MDQTKCHGERSRKQVTLTENQPQLRNVHAEWRLQNVPPPESDADNIEGSANTISNHQRERSWKNLHQECRNCTIIAVELTEHSRMFSKGVADHRQQFERVQATNRKKPELN